MGEVLAEGMGGSGMSDGWLLAGSRIGTVFAAGAAGKDINDADGAASNAVKNNYLNHRELMEKKNKVESCEADIECAALGGMEQIEEMYAAKDELRQGIMSSCTTEADCNFKMARLEREFDELEEQREWYFANGMGKEYREQYGKMTSAGGGIQGDQLMNYGTQPEVVATVAGVGSIGCVLIPGCAPAVGFGLSFGSILVGGAPVFPKIIQDFLSVDNAIDGLQLGKDFSLFLLQQKIPKPARKAGEVFFGVNGLISNKMIDESQKKRQDANE